jgi:TPR repeat protein
MRNILLVAAGLCLLVGCKSKLDKCNHACDDVKAEKAAACHDDPASCKRSIDEWAESCHDLCKTVVESQPKALDKTADEAGCDKDDKKACQELAEMYALGRGGVTKDDSKAVALFEKACNLGDAVSCEFRGKMLREGRGGPADPAGAIAWFTKGCNGGAAGACTSLGLAAMKSGDKKTAVEMLEKACNGDDKIGCTGLGGLYLHGNGVPKDPARAQQLLKKACDLGAKEACDKVTTP